MIEILNYNKQISELQRDLENAGTITFKRQSEMEKKHVVAIKKRATLGEITRFLYLLLKIDIYSRISFPLHSLLYGYIK
jgi:hypothetical protein